MLYYLLTAIALILVGVIAYHIGYERGYDVGNDEWRKRQPGVAEQDELERIGRL